MGAKVTRLETNHPTKAHSISNLGTSAAHFDQTQPPVRPYRITVMPKIHKQATESATQFVDAEVRS